MRRDVKEADKRELALARQARRERSLDQAVRNLERAHILGQRYFLPHLHTHLQLLAVATERADLREMAGQIIRVIAVIPGYLSGWVPKGNTGSANVSALQPMTPPADLARLLADHSVARDVAMRVILWSLLAASYVLATAPTGMEMFRVR